MVNHIVKKMIAEEDNIPSCYTSKTSWGILLNLSLIFDRSRL